MSFTFRALFGGLPNRSDEATLSGGSYQATLPLTNMQNRRLKQVARSTDATLPNTQWQGDFGATKTIGICALLNLNWSSSARWRFRLRANAPSPETVKTFGANETGLIATGAGTLYGSTGNFCITMWVKCSLPISFAVDLAGLFSTGVVGGLTAHSTAVNPSTAKWLFWWTTGAGAVPHVLTTSQPTVLLDGSWHHVGWSVSGTTLSLVIDGDLVQTWVDATLSSRDAPAINDDVSLNRFTGDGGANGAAMAYRQIAYWSASRTTSEIGADMFRTFTGTETNLVGLWSGAITAGPILNNLTSNNLDFALSNSNTTTWAEASITYDSGLLDAFPAVEEFGTLPWGEFQWGGALPAEISEALTPNVFHVCSTIVQARYYSVEIFDVDNADGYVDVGRALVGPYFQPSLNMDWGFSMGYEDESLIDKSRGGQTYIEARDVFRSTRFSFSNMTEAEALQQVLFWLQRRLGVRGDFVFIPFPQRPELASLTAIYCRMRSLPPIYNSAFEQWQSQFELEELL